MIIDSSLPSSKMILECIAEQVLQWITPVLQDMLFEIITTAFIQSVFH